jgi:para-nitrobenzyl esterase
MEVSRRRLLAGGGALGLLGSSPARAGSDAAPLELAIASGRVRGVREASARVFRGLPYAEPPVGPLRFKPPRPPAPWSGVRTAVTFGPAAIQAPGALTGGSPTSEDCLYLNVWAPLERGPHPVLVWIHGGGNAGGASSHAPYDGANFARDGIVFVSMNYRVGALGFLELGEVLGPGYAGSGNNALKDQAAALRWVRRNISAFGGDPGRVTLGSTLAGSRDAYALLAAPPLAGLFQRAVIESGRPVVATAAEATLVARGVVQGLGGESARLLSAPAEEILAAQTKAGQAMGRAGPFRPVIEAGFLPRSPVEALAQGASAKVPLLLGCTRDETALAPAKPGVAEPPLTQRRFAMLSLAEARRAEAAYARAFPALSDYDRRQRLLTAADYAIPGARVAEAHARSGGVAYLYRFDRSPADGPLKGRAVNGAEIAYVFDNLDKGEVVDSGGGFTSQDRALAAQVHQAWVAFIKGGPPAAPGLPAWPRYGPERRLTMVLDHSSVVESDPLAVERALWDGVGARA